MQFRYTEVNQRKDSIASMDNLQTEKLELHEGHEDDFDEDSEEVMDENHPMWRSERITLNSVGIDIGSSTSHLIFSRLTLRRQGVALSSRFVVINREIIHESPILLTPYIDKTTIDTNSLGDFIHEAYRKANLTPDHRHGRGDEEKKRRSDRRVVFRGSWQIRLRHGGA